MHDGLRVLYGENVTKCSTCAWNMSVIHEISFPMGTDGPITPATAARLMDPSRPFTMTPGQWGFIHNEWITRGVEFLSLSAEGSHAPGGIPVPFQRDTDTLSATSGVEESKDEVGDVPLQAPSCEQLDQIDTSPEAEEASATSQDAVPPAAGIALTRAQYIKLMQRLESVEKISKPITFS